MSDHEHMSMLPQLEELKQAYRNVKAPGTLAARIRHTISESARPKRRHWLPISVGAMAVVGMAVIVSFAFRDRSTHESAIRARPIPLSMIRGHVPTHPAFAMPTLRDVGPVPLIPPRQDTRSDDLRSPGEPQTRLPTSCPGGSVAG